MRFSRSDEENEPLISLQSKGPCTLSPTSIGYDDDMGGTGRFFESNWARFRQPSVCHRLPVLLPEMITCGLWLT
jgi:hypothetical protein